MKKSLPHGRGTVRFLIQIHSWKMHVFSFIIVLVGMACHSTLQNGKAKAGSTKCLKHAAMGEVGEGQAEKCE